MSEMIWGHASVYRQLRAKVESKLRALCGREVIGVDPGSGGRCTKVVLKAKMHLAEIVFEFDEGLTNLGIAAFYDHEAILIRRWPVPVSVRVAWSLGGVGLPEDFVNAIITWLEAPSE